MENIYEPNDKRQEIKIYKQHIRVNAFQAVVIIAIFLSLGFLFIYLSSEYSVKYGKNFGYYVLDFIALCFYGKTIKMYEQTHGLVFGKSRSIVDIANEQKLKSQSEAEDKEKQ